MDQAVDSTCQQQNNQNVTHTCLLCEMYSDLNAVSQTMKFDAFENIQDFDLFAEIYPVHPSQLAVRPRNDLQRKVRDGTPGLHHLQQKNKF